MKTLDKSFKYLTELIFAALIVFGSCNSNNKKSAIKVSDIESNACYESDTRIIKYFIKEWLKQDKKAFPKEYFYKDTAQLQGETFNIDTIIYSYNQSKFFATIIMKSSIDLLNDFEKTEWGSDSSYFYGSRAVLGYRKTKKSKWQVQFFDQYIGNLFYSYESAQNYIRDSYFNRIQDQFFVKRGDNKKMELVKIGKNVTSSDFWTCVVWDSLSFRKGYFPFELNNLGEPNRTLCNEYPDTLKCE